MEEVKSIKRKGKQKITIEQIENKNKRYVTFTKRRKGLFKKARELSSMCGAQVGVITFSCAGKLFLSPDSEGPIHRFIHDHNSVAADDENAPVFGENKDDCEEVLGTTQGSYDDQSFRRGFWWEQSIDGLGLAELQRFKTALEGLRNQVAFKIDYQIINDNGSNTNNNSISEDGTSTSVVDNPNDFDLGLMDGINGNCVANDESDTLLDILLNDYC